MPARVGVAIPPSPLAFSVDCSKPDVMADHKIVALSGTSGGAMCALLA